MKHLNKSLAAFLIKTVEYRFNIYDQLTMFIHCIHNFYRPGTMIGMTHACDHAPGMLLSQPQKHNKPSVFIRA